MTFASNTLTAQTFLLATAEDSSTSASMTGVGDGLLGLAFQDVPVDPSGGRLILGGIDTSLYTGSITFIPITPYPTKNQDSSVSSSYFWSIATTSVTVSGSSAIAAPQNTLAIIDTGTTLIIIDSATLSAIVQQMNGLVQYSSRDGYYETLCSSTLPDITFTLGGVAFTFSAEDYLIPADTTETVCVL
ncbi:hypothetical protein HDU99_008811, partial [Rhizoclosmatium hyalinum]